MDYFKFAYGELIEEFDEVIAEDAFQCEKLEAITKNFLDNHKELIATIKYGSLPKSTYPNCSPAVALEEDLQLFTPSQNEANQVKDVPEEAQICAGLYRRLCQATYMNQTLNTFRDKNTKLDRNEPVSYARIALRYNANDREAAILYSMTMGWYCDTLGHGMEKVRLGRLFYRSLTHNLRVNSDKAIVHHIVGRYYMSVAQLNWIERKLASQLMSSEELGYSAKDAEQSLNKAHELDPEIAPTGLWMARVLEFQKKPREEIIKWIELGLKAKSREPINDLERAQLEEFKRKGKY